MICRSSTSFCFSQSAFCSESPFGSRNLFLLWELCPVHRLECAYMVGKLRPGREAMETDVQDRRNRERKKTFVRFGEIKYVLRRVK